MTDDSFHDFCGFGLLGLAVCLLAYLIAHTYHKEHDEDEWGDL